MNWIIYIFIFIGLNHRSESGIEAFKFTKVAKVGEDVLLTCNIKVPRDFRIGDWRKVNWYRNNEKNKTAYREVKQRRKKFYDTIPNTYIISDLQKEHEGTYNCSVHYRDINKDRTVDYPATELIVIEKIVTAVKGGTAEIPCYYGIQRQDYDYIFAVKWSKGKDEELYMFKVGKGKYSEGKHNPFIHDKYFKHMERPPRLELQNLTEKDEGRYTCVVFFDDKYPMKKTETDLRVIVPPTKVEILYSNSEPAGENSGPFKEFSNIVLKCRVHGGEPAPQIYWYEGSQLKNETTSRIVAPDIQESTLLLRNVTRLHHGSTITCQGKNTDLAAPVSSKTNLDIHYSPEVVQILTRTKDYFVDGKKQTVKCLAVGGRPAPIITWSVDNNIIGNNETEETYKVEEKTISTLQFVPVKNYEGKTLTCSAKSYDHQPLGDAIELKIYYKPEVKLDIINARQTAVKEGDQISMKCEVDSKPPFKNITWTHQSRPLKDKEEIRGIHYRNEYHSEVLLNPVSYKMVGYYSCTAYNQVGSGTSKPEYLNIDFVPRCKEKKTVIIGAGRNEWVKPKCRVKASPSDTSFRWKFNGTDGTVRDIAQGEFTNEDKVSILNYQPTVDEDFGYLQCWAKNEMGEQADPCIFKVIEAGLPGRPENCTVKATTHSQISIDCIAGHDGGLPQRFVAKVWDVHRTEASFNVTFIESNFVLENLTAGTTYYIYIYASNAKGNSDNFLLEGQTQIDPQIEFPGPMQELVFPVTAIIGVLVGVVSALVIVSIVIVIIMKLRSNGNEKNNEKVQQTQLRTGEGDRNVRDNSNDPERNIGGGYPKKLRHANLYETSGYESTSSREDKATQGEEGEVEYTELEFSTGKGKSRKKNKKSKSAKKPRDEATIYASIDIARTEKQSQSKQKKPKKNGSSSDPPYRQLSQEPKRHPVEEKVPLVIPPSPPPPLLTPPLESARIGGTTASFTPKKAKNGNTPKGNKDVDNSDDKQTKDNIPLMDEALESSL